VREAGQPRVAGAEIVDRSGAFGCELVLKVRSPQADELSLMKRGTALVGMLNPFDRDGLQRLAEAGLTSFALEAAPRTTRAQSMDVLSSQANIAGYKAVMIAADRYQRFFPMLMTAAGTVKAARVVILGVGVAGLQAIATAKRLGAVIEASDVRPSVKEQVESLESTNESVLSHRLNDSFRILTAASVVLLPLTLVASIFGMNFDVMPGLHKTYGFWLSVVGMIGVVAGMLLYFRHKRWL